MRIKRFFGGLLSLILTSALIGALVLVFQGRQKNPAHQPLVSGFSICQADGQYLVTWQVKNSQTETGQDMTVSTIDRTVTGIEVGTNVPPSGSVQGTELVPGNTSGTITLHVGGHWNYDGFNAAGEGSVNLGGTCVLVTSTDKPPDPTPMTATSKATSTATLTPSPTNTPTETEVAPSETPSATATQTSTEVSPSATPSPTNTDLPTATETPTDTPVPTATDTPTETGVPNTSTPTETGTPPVPSETPSPSASPSNTSPVNTSTATATGTNVLPSETPTPTQPGPSATPTFTQPGPSQTPSPTSPGPSSTPPTPWKGTVNLTIRSECQDGFYVVIVRFGGDGNIVFHIKERDTQILVTDLTAKGQDIPVVLAPGKVYEWSIDYDHTYTLIGPASQDTIDATAPCAATTPVATSTPGTGNPPPPSGGGIPGGLLLALFVVGLPAAIISALLLRRRQGAG